MKNIFSFVFLILFLSACDIEYRYDEDCHSHNNNHYHCHEEPQIYHDYNTYETYYSEWYGFEPYEEPCYTTPWEGNVPGLWCEAIYCYDFDFREWDLYDIICY